MSEQDLGKTIHMILKRDYYDLIEKGEKTIEYRGDTAYWRRRILKWYGKDVSVTFHKGYTKKTMTFHIAKVKLNLSNQWEIHLGERLA